MDRRSTMSLWRDYGIPMQDPKAYSLQYGKNSTKDPRKGLIRSKNRKRTDNMLKDTTGLLKTPAIAPEKKQLGGRIQTQPAVDTNKYLYNKEQFKDPLLKNIEQTDLNRRLKYRDVRDRYETILRGINKNIPLSDAKTFTISDIENNKPGIRNNAKINRQVVAQLAIAAAKEGVPIMDALSTAMRESGIGSYAGTYEAKTGVANTNQVYNPQHIMQSWSSDELAGIPKSYDQFLITKNIVPKEGIRKTRHGYNIDFSKVPDTQYMEYADKYKEYLDGFKQDPTLQEPFIKEMRFMKSTSERAYNPGERDRAEKMARERKVIAANPKLYNYADSTYRANIPKDRLLTMKRNGGLLNK